MNKWINGYEGLYSVSSEGIVYRHLKSGDVKEMTRHQNGSGYLCVVLSKDSEGTNKLVHRLVAEAYVPNPDNLPIVDHIDEDKTNPSASNLRWVTTQQNKEYYCTKDGRRLQIERGRKRKAQLNDYRDALIEKVRKLKDMEKELAATTRKLEAVTKELKLKKEVIEAQQKALEEYRKRELNRGTSYSGYADTKGMKFTSTEAMVGLVGKKIKVNGEVYPSCKSAAKSIVEKELVLGYTRSEATISKELRRFLQGLRPAWSMYGRYEVVGVQPLLPQYKI